MRFPPLSRHPGVRRDLQNIRRKIPAFAGMTIMGALAIGLFSSPAIASEVYQWQAPHTQFSATFPEDWRQVSDQQPDDVLTIQGPKDSDYAMCRLRQREDRRFVIYPRENAGAVQRSSYNYDFWKTYMGEFNGASLNDGHDNAGLGQGFASYADISFVPSVGPQIQKRGIMLASVYNDKAYIFECSADVKAFDKWDHTFLDILKSVNFRKEYYQNYSGNYRPFEADRKLEVDGVRQIDSYVY